MRGNSSFGRKINVCLTALIACLVVLGGTAVWSVRSLDSTISDAYQIQVKKLDRIDALETGAAKLIASHRGVLLWRFGKDEARSKAYAAQLNEMKGSMTAV